MSHFTFTIAFMSAFVIAAASNAAAQKPDPQQPGPLLVERIHNGWLFTPEVRATDLNGEANALAGGYAGRIYDNTWAIGGGAYFLTNPDDNFKLGYGGAVVEWLARTDRRVGFGVRTLVGGGSATMPVAFAESIDDRELASRMSRRRFPQWDPTGTIGMSDGFFVAEPQVNLLLNLSRGQRIVFGLGYRATAFASRIGDQVNGVSGSVSYQFGGGK